MSGRVKAAEQVGEAPTVAADSDLESSVLMEDWHHLSEQGIHFTMSTLRAAADVALEILFD
jgi:hypothetical protein